MSSFWQAETQLAIYGKKHFSSSGFQRLNRGRNGLEAQLGRVDLSRRVVLIAGGDHGIGFEVAQYAADKGARVIILCETSEGGSVACRKICAAARTMLVTHLNVVDFTSMSYLQRAMAGLDVEALDCIVWAHEGCRGTNRERTPEGFEATYAEHLAGPCALVKLALPLLLQHGQRTPPAAAAEYAPRVIILTSPELYTAKFPASWDALAGDASRDASAVFAAAKRLFPGPQ